MTFQNNDTLLFGKKIIVGRKSFVVLKCALFVPQNRTIACVAKKYVFLEKTKFFVNIVAFFQEFVEKRSKMHNVVLFETQQFSAKLLFLIQT